MRRFAGTVRLTSEAEREASLRATLARRPAGRKPVWLFAYGALMWQPEARGIAEVRPVRIDGWRRAFCVWSVVARGTPENPGLGLGLLPGGAVEGLALRIEDEALLPQVWAQEMYAGVYRPDWLAGQAVGSGEALDLLAFLAEPAHPQFAAGLSLPEQAALIRSAVGENGPARDYLAATVAALHRHQLSDPALEELLRLVEAG